MSFLETALSRLELSEDIEGYLLGRGARETTIAELGIKTWSPLKTPHDDPAWKHRYGPEGRGEWIDGWAVIPLYSPRGHLIGFEARNPNPSKEYKSSQFYLPEAAWNPIWLGMRPSVMEKIWAGGDVWVSKGFFDSSPLEWAIPSSDVSLATGRSFLGPRHLAFLKRFCAVTKSRQGARLTQMGVGATVHVVYDNDEDGKKGTFGYLDEKTGKERWGALRKLTYAGIDNRQVPYHGVKDPGELWDRQGPEGLRRAFEITY